AVPRHPGVVPHQHHDRDRQDRGVEQFLTGALEHLRDRAREGRDQASAEHAARDAERDPAAAPDDTLRCGHHDADDQPGLENFTKDDDECAEHFYSAITTPFAVASLYSPMKS